MVDFNTNGHASDPKPPGGGGALFRRKDNLRSDARMAARMIALGVIPIAEAKELLRAGMKLAKRSAETDDPRGYSACMKIAIEVAKLAQSERHKMLDKTIPDQHAVHHTVEELRAAADETRRDKNYVEFERQRAIEAHPYAGLNGRNGKSGPVESNGSSGAH